jgi:activator of 2-hydroxyglutaryl-CoA dehydratase/predicted nucleotide-binding protein (sugar kinase/HSP70/actin superfamily)
MNTYAVGIDVGSTTVKAVVMDPVDLKILWSDYQRHETRQPEKTLEFLVRIGHAFPDATFKVFLTGSGASPLCAPIGARFVQEVNAVTLAVEKLHPDVGSVIELGGQDAKIIMFRENVETGEKQAGTSMNDKCASGTGATIDKCMLKVGMAPDVVRAIEFDPLRLHHVAAKCGVFAETDIVNLVKSGIPGDQIMNSLADAIVHQNLSVLTRGNTLRHKVLLLGGPNTYLPFLVACWRKRIPETWAERGHEWPKDIPLEELIFVPENAQYYAAFGAVVYGLTEDIKVDYRGLDGLKDYMQNGRAARLGASAGSPLLREHDDLEVFTDEYKVPKFVSATLSPGQVVRAVIGMDGGSTSSKAVLVDETGTIIRKEYQLSKGNPIQDTKEILTRLQAWVTDQGATLDVIGFGATGYAADVLQEAVRSDVNIVETVAHMMSAVRFVPDADVICDIGGQDIKVLMLEHGDIKNFRLSNQCSAGNGMLLQAMADQFGLPVQDYAQVAFGAKLAPKFSYGCAVFLDTDRVNFQKEGFTKEELLAGLAQVLPKNVWQYVVQIPRLAELGKVFVLQGGTQHNLAAVKAQVDYIKDRVPGAVVKVHPHTGEAGAIGAAFETLRVVTRKGSTRFIGMEQAIALTYTSTNDESTKCTFCPNNCSRTFIDTVTPAGDTSRYISGFSCEKGTVESKDALKVLAKKQNEIKRKFPNLVEEESRMAFAHFYEPAPLPSADTYITDVEVRKGFLGKIQRRAIGRRFERSNKEWQQYRKETRIGIPRVLNIYQTGPLFRTFFEAAGIPKENVIFSEQTSEEMWVEGGKYGSIDPCYPSKVTQAHIHNLIFHKHEKVDGAARTGPLDFIFFPCLTHIPSYVSNVMDTASCPIVAGAPNVMKAAFTKEIDFFKRAGIEYVDPALTLVERNLFNDQMFRAWGARLGLTRDECDHACVEGFKALDAFDLQIQEKGKNILETVERENRVAILMIGRPYHSDPGLNHGIPDEFQVLGYPILSMRSIPKDPAWLTRFFKDDLTPGPDGKARMEDVFDVRDVWPENFSANSVQKVWATKFAAHHPNVVILDLSSFKCGHDAPTYGLIDSIVKASQTPYSALHDIDANKPGGSIKIRVKTYAHRLALFEEELADQVKKKSELERRVAEKRAELMARKYTSAEQSASAK